VSNVSSTRNFRKGKKNEERRKIALNGADSFNNLSS
jgi:hypothetical protein